ncbi:MAG: Hsp20/alpha crystallin family protein [Pseudomonadota bacterium]
MFRKLNDIDKIFGTMDFFKNQMNRFFEDFENNKGNFTQSGGWPRTNFFDDGDIINVYSEISGINENDINIKLHNNLLTLSGERKPSLPEGYAVLRQERLYTPFSRSFTLSAEIDPEKTSATLKNGILTVKLVKAQPINPKKISVTAA